MSIKRLLPQEIGNPNNLDWDYSSIASLTRNLLEAHLYLFYFGIENISESEWLMRKWLIDLHDGTARVRLYGDDILKNNAETTLKWLKDRLDGHPMFSKLPERQRLHFLSGRHPCFLNHDEIIERMEQDRAQFRAIYERLSSEAHSLPLAFHRMISGDFGRGFENHRDKAHMAIALSVASNSLELATTQLKSIFPEVEFSVASV